MKRIYTFAFVLLFAVFQNASAQQQIPMGPLTLVQEALVGDVVCTMSRQFGQPSILTFSVAGSANVAKLADDITKCATEVRRKFAEVDKPDTKKKT